MTEPYYRPDLALAHHLGFGAHADRCAPGVLHHLEPVLRNGGLVVEVGCGSGLLTRHLVDAGHRVIATDASAAMLELAKEYVPNALEHRVLALPDDPIPQADAIVSVGHVVNYVATPEELTRSMVAMSEALRPDGRIVFDICDVEWGVVRANAPPYGAVGDDWATITRYSAPQPHIFIRHITAFVRINDATWRRDDERHDNVLIDTSTIPELLAQHGVTVSVSDRFGAEEQPPGLKTVVGIRARQPA